MSASNRFTAEDSFVGYLYQLRVALLWSLRRLPAGADFLVSVETLDDVTFETKGGTPIDLVQTKHHRSRQASLTDYSTDIWKSLRIWFEADAAGMLEPGTVLHLLTTAAAPIGSAASKLRSASRDVEAALVALEAVSSVSSNDSNQKAYQLFRSLERTKRRALLDRVIVIDAGPTISQVDDDLKVALFSAVDRSHLNVFLEYLEGWWLRRVLKQVTTHDDRILADELECQLSDLREQFKQDNLPVDDELLEFTLDEATHAAHSQSTFVRQIELTKANKHRIAAAIRDYYRAFEQRSRWLRDELVFVGELHKYERALVEEWEIYFAGVQDEIGDNATEVAKEQAARKVLRWAEEVLQPIRPRVSAPFVTRGSLHMLSDSMRVGWHPEFAARLGGLLRTGGGAP